MMVEQSQRWVFLAVLLLVFLLVGVARLVDLQVIRGVYFGRLAQENRIRRLPIRAPRGEILDVNGKSLARNIPVYKLATFSEGGVVAETQEISREEALRIQAEDPEKAARLLVDVGREYPFGEAAAHVVGYVNQANKEEIGEYQLGDLIGRIGIEAQYDELLRGINGEELLEVDTGGRLVRRLGRREPVPGQSIKLSIDAGLQETVYKALQNAPGAVVAQDPATGEVLALVSVPSFDPNAISSNYSQLSTDPNLPLFNRAIGGVYPPGSTYKLVSAVAGLEEEKIDEEYEYKDTGIIQVGAFSFRNWYFTQYGRTEGVINIVRAITRSTDTFFYKVGEMVGPRQLAGWSEKFGLGEKTGIDLPAEATGIVPTPEWKERVRGERWFLGNTYHLAIGQGDITATPLQINQMTGVIAHRGVRCAPHLVGAEACEDLSLQGSSLELVTLGMVGACSPGGTAFPFFTFAPQTACKTGTAEFGDPEDRTHAWFTAFAPAPSTSEVESENTSEVNQDRIVVTVLVEGGGEGSRVAAPVARDILDYWFHER